MDDIALLSVAINILIVVLARADKNDWGSGYRWYFAYDWRG